MGQKQQGYISSYFQSNQLFQICFKYFTLISVGFPRDLMEIYCFGSVSWERAGRLEEKKKIDIFFKKAFISARKNFPCIFIFLTQLINCSQKSEVNQTLLNICKQTGKAGKKNPFLSPLLLHNSVQVARKSGLQKPTLYNPRKT